MGWLTDKSKAVGLLTLIELGRAMRKEDKGIKLAPRTLTNHLGEADKGDGRWWLAGKGKALRPLLAKVLHISLDELERELSASRAKPEDANRIELEPFPEVKLNLESDETFVPGFPPELMRDGGSHIDRAWWTISDGSEKWVARWLEARFAWRTVVLHRWEPKELPRVGRIFVALASAEGMPPDWVKDVPAELRICVACRDAVPRAVGPTGDSRREPPSTKPSAEQPAFTELRFRPSTEWLDELLEWVTPRIASGGGFSKEAARRVLREHSDSVSSPADALALLSLIEEIGAEVFRKDSRRLLRDWLKRAEERFTADDEPLIRRRGDEFLLCLEIERLRAVRPRELSLDSWSSLVPPSFAPPLDRRRTAGLIRTGKPNDALALLEADASDWVAALEQAGVLRHTRDALFELHPPWLSRAVDDLAYEALWKDDALDTLMLNASTSARAIRQLVEELRNKNDARIKRWLSKDANAAELDASWLAAFDGIFRAVGIALTIPGLDVSDELVRRVWDVHERSSQRHPLDGTWPATPWVSVGGSSGLQSEGAHFLAAAAISLRLGREPSALGPTQEWLGSEQWSAQRQTAEQVFKAIHDAFAGEVGGDLSLAPYRLGEQLLAQLGDSPVWELNVLQHPAMLAQFASTGRPASSLNSMRFNWPAMRDACSRTGVSLARALERAWSACHVWAITDLLQKQPQLAEEIALLFSTVSGDHLRAAATSFSSQLPKSSGLGRNIDIPWMNRPEVWRHLQPSVWEFWLNSGGGVTEAMLEVMPEPVALRLLSWNWSWFARGTQEGPAPEVARVLWRRLPRQVAKRIVDVANAGELWGRVEVLAHVAPEPECEVVIEKLTSAKDDRLRLWLMEVVRRRYRGWRKAATLLAASSRGAAGEAVGMAPRPPAKSSTGRRARSKGKGR